MNGLGAVSGKVQREVEIIKKLNSALLVIEAGSLGRSCDFGFSDHDLSESRKFLLDFAERLRAALTQESPPLSLRPVVDHLKSGMKPIKDWIDDLQSLIEQIQSNQLTMDTSAILEDILSLLDAQFTDDLQRLYAR